MVKYLIKALNLPTKLGLLYSQILSGCTHCCLSLRYTCSSGLLRYKIALNRFIFLHSRYFSGAPLVCIIFDIFQFVLAVFLPLDLLSTVLASQRPNLP